MGKLKEDLFAAVLEALRSVPGGSTYLSTLNHPANGPVAVRSAWYELQKAGTAEGLKRGCGLKQVLSERPDLFAFPAEKGHPLITLAEAAREEASGGEALEEMPDMHPQPAEVPADDGYLDRPAKRHKTKAKFGEFGKWVSIYGDGGFSDVVWTPQLAAAKAREEKNEKEMARALFEAVQNHPGNVAKVSALGHDFKVTQLKKEPQFKNEKMIDTLERHEDVFEIFEDGTIQLHPGAEAALPDADEHLEAEKDDDSILLPVRIEEPKAQGEKMQALRIEILYCLHRRGGKSALQELGQEPRVSHLRQTLQQAQRLGDFVKHFPQNFLVSASDNGQVLVQIASYEVHDEAGSNASPNARTGPQASKGWHQSPSTSPPNHNSKAIRPQQAYPSYPAYQSYPSYPSYPGWY